MTLAPESANHVTSRRGAADSRPLGMKCNLLLAQAFLGQFHFRSTQAVNSTTDEAARAGADGDFYIRDLQENIAAGNVPS